MAKRLTPNQKVWKKEYKLYKRRARNLEKQGYIVPDIKQPKRITKKAIKDLHDLRRSKLKNASYKEEPDTSSMYDTYGTIYLNTVDDLNKLSIGKEAVRYLESIVTRVGGLDRNKGMAYVGYAISQAPASFFDVLSFMKPSNDAPHQYSTLIIQYLPEIDEESMADIAEYIEDLDDEY